MAAQRPICQQRLEQPKVIRALVESRTLTGNDLLELALTSKAMFRLVYQECRRDKIKRLPFQANRRSPVWSVIELDDPEGLKEALELGEFDKDTTSPNGRLLHANGRRGVHLLMGMCIERGSASCLDFLRTWVDSPSTPFTYDPMWVHEKAKSVGLRSGRLECLLYLHDRDKEEESPSYPSPTALYTTLLKQARSPAAIHWLSHRMPPNTDYLPVLIAQAGNRYTQPTVLEALIDLVPRGTLSSTISDPTDNNNNPCTVTALSAAASALHTSAIDVLLRWGARAFHPDPAKQTGNSIVTVPSSSNPLFCALAAQHLPLGRPKPHSSPRPVPPRKLANQRWLATAVKPRATAMHATVAYLTEAAEIEFSVFWRKDPGRGQQVMGEMLDFAGLVFVFSLRVFLLGNLGWLLSSSHSDGDGYGDGDELRQRLLIDAVPGRVTAWSETPFVACSGRSVSVGGEGEDVKIAKGEADLGVTWREGLSGRWVRARLREEGVGLVKPLEEIWNMLLTPTTAELAARYLKFRPEKVESGNSLDLLWELLVAAEREGSVLRETPRKVKVDDAECPEAVDEAKRRKIVQEAGAGGR
ncbi:hypothetical protein C8A03DRAFT_14810 [Achaetomium macrosporum]|uniref:Uncharacterized protein n=1 Tax=Achaetomium macrosporum TaxID=79813 RepID=A0AAN7CB31_9PEZI|nr:hypothetical protein C8A03DRAFT_14810 [Achaetomium macrosporum]